MRLVCRQFGAAAAFYLWSTGIILLSVLTRILIVTITALVLAAACDGGGTTEPSPSPPDPPTPTDVSTDSPVPTTPPPGPATTYTVQPGDTLTAIADKFGVTVEQIVAVNDIEDPDVILVGDVLTIPGSTPTVAP